MSHTLRETAVALEYRPAPAFAPTPGSEFTPDSGIPWPWNVPDGQWTWELFCQLPESVGTRYEVIGGRLTVSPTPRPRHQAVAAQLTTLLNTWAIQTKAGRVFGPVDVVLPSAQQYWEPDLIFVAKDRLLIVGETNIQGAPDLIVEIISPSTARADWVDKKNAYEGGGVAHYWVVDPAGKSLTAFRLKDGKYEPAGRLENDAVFEPEGFHGLKVNLAEVWE